MATLLDDAVRSWVADCYELMPPITARLLRTYTNDVYAVQDAEGRYMLKLYGVGWRSDPEVAYEVDLLAHLAAHGVSVARAIPGRDRRQIQRLATPAGPRVAVLFEHAVGSKPTPPFSPELYETIGQAAATLHRAADDFVSPHPRRPIDTELLLDKPMALIAPRIPDRTERIGFLGTVGRLRDTIVSLAACGLDWGPCHGDLSLDNLHLTEDGRVVWYDFDSGGPGWRAMDLPGWATFVPDATPRATAFLRGYRAGRRLNQVDIEAAPYLAIAVGIWGMQIDLERRVLARGDAAVGAYVAEKTDDLRQWASVLGVS